MRDTRQLREQPATPPERPAGRIEPPPSPARIAVTADRPIGPGEGAVGGVLGGLAMGVFAMVVAAVMGQGFWAPLKMIAATFYGEGAMAQPGFAAGPVLVGLTIHMVVSAVYGGIYGAIGRVGWSTAAVIGWALAFGLAIWALADWVILPVFNPMMSAQAQPILFALEHAIFGLVLGWYLAARRNR